MTDKPLSRRRAGTRERLLDAAWSEFTSRGYAVTSVENVCERAGFTRGAFYSNFTTKDDIFLALHRRQVDRVISELETRRARRRGAADLAETVAEVLGGLASDREWYLLRTEFLLHAARRPEAAAALVTSRTQLRDRLAEILAETLEELGLHATVPVGELAGWLLLVDDGGIARSLIEPVDPHDALRSLTPLIVAGATETVERSCGKAVG